MADITPIGGRPKIIRPGYDTADLAPATMSRDELVDAELGILRGQVRQLQSVIDGMRGTINLHHQAMTELMALTQSLEDRTLRGRWRRVCAWVYAAAEAIVLHVDPAEHPVGVPIPPAGSGAALAAAEANPEAMPKP